MVVEYLINSNYENEMNTKTLKEMTNSLSETLNSFDKSIEKIIILPHYRNEYTSSELDETVVEIKSCLKELRNAVENINNRLCTVEHHIDDTNNRLRTVENNIDYTDDY